MKVSRPVVRWHGGKWMIAPWIISHFPPHRFYTEAYGGGASVLLQKPRVYSEVYNDLDGDIVNLFRVLQDPKDSKRLEQLLALTPFAREEFKLAYKKTRSNVERARRLIIRSFMGFGSNAHNVNKSSGFRACSNRSGTTPAHDWRNYPAQLPAIVERLRGVVIECRPAIDILKQHDSPETLHYVDPPYLKSTRTDSGHDYNFEMTNADHEELSEVLKTLRGGVILSGYKSALYDRLYPSWQRIERSTYADGALKRTEALWISPAARSGAGLFAVSA